MFELKQLYEDRAEIAKEVRRLANLCNDDAHEWSAEDEEHWKEANEDYNELTRKIQMEERANEIESSLQEKSDRRADIVRGKELRTVQDQNAREESDRQELEALNDPRGRKYGRQEEVSLEERCLALQAWCRVQSGLELTDEQRQACRKANSNPTLKDFTVQLRRGSYSQVRREYRALTTQATSGGDTIPEGFVNNFERAMLQFAGIRQVADVMRTASGNDMPWPTSDDTGNEGALIAENTQVSEQDITTGAVVFSAYKYTSKLIRVPVELLQDSAFDLANTLGSMLGERIGRITAGHFTTGDGSSKPNGILTAATLGKTAASQTAVTADEILDLVHSVDPSYREGPGVGFMFHDNILLVIRKLKDGDGNYLWQPGFQSGVPERLVNFPITINQKMPSTMTATTKIMLFGMLSKYKIRDVAEFRLRRLVERYADYDQEGFVAFSRHDGDLLDAGTHPVKYLALAT